MKVCRYGFLSRQRQQCYISPASRRSVICFANTVNSELLFKQDNKLLLNAMIYIVFMGTHNLLSLDDDNKFYSYS